MTFAEQLPMLAADKDPGRPRQPMTEPELARIRLPRRRDDEGEAELPASVAAVLRYDQGFELGGVSLVGPLLEARGGDGRVRSATVDALLRRGTWRDALASVPEDVPLWNPDPALPALVPLGTAGPSPLFLYIGEPDEDGEYPLVRIDDQPEMWISDASVAHHVLEQLTGGAPGAAAALRRAKERNEDRIRAEWWNDHPVVRAAVNRRT